MTISLRRWVGAALFLGTPVVGAHAQAAAPVRDTMPAYRSRLLGTFDDASGEPLGGVRVLDVLNGTWTETTSTGTAVLTFLPDSGGGANVPAFDLSLYDLSNLAAIEWYPDGAVMPIEFSKTSERCGALLLWTRER